MLLEQVTRQNKEGSMEAAKNRCSRPLFSLSAVYEGAFLQVIPLLKLKIVEDISYPEQDRQSVSSMPEQIGGMGGQG